MKQKKQQKEYIHEEAPKAVFIRNISVIAFVLLLYGLDFYIDVRGRDSLSWMDPNQYYRFAVELCEEAASIDSFELPSIFPFLIYPFTAISTSIPSALWANYFFAVILAIAVYHLRKELNIRMYPAILLTVILACPLLIGLSRELYLEYALTAIVAMQFALWFKTNDFTKFKFNVWFAVLFAIGIMTKMTYPLFFIFPFLGLGYIFIRKKQFRSLFKFIITFAAPAIVVIIIQAAFFPESFRYYTSLGNTTFPIMKLLGPVEIFSLESITYYFYQLGISILIFLTPFLLIPVLFLGNLKNIFEDQTAKDEFILWLWFTGPLLFLILQPVKEPRHVAPCIVPAVLLIFKAIEKIKNAKAALALTILIITASFMNYIYVTHHKIHCPYFMDSPMMVKKVEQTLKDSDPNGYAKLIRLGKTTDDHWKFKQNIAVAGFKPNEALTYIWHFHPAIVYNLNLLEKENLNRLSIPYQSFEDLYTYTSFNTYNYRCNWPVYLSSLDKQTIIANSDYIISKIPLGSMTQQHKLIGTITAKDGDIHIYKNTAKTEHYRILYAKEFLKRNADLTMEELKPIHYEMFMTLLLRETRFNPNDLLEYFPQDFRPTGTIRNIYYYGTYQGLYNPNNAVYVQYIRQLRSVKR